MIKGWSIVCHLIGFTKAKMCMVRSHILFAPVFNCLVIFFILWTSSLYSCCLGFLALLAGTSRGSICTMTGTINYWPNRNICLFRDVVKLCHPNSFFSALPNGCKVSFAFESPIPCYKSMVNTLRLSGNALVQTHLLPMHLQNCGKHT